MLHRSNGQPPTVLAFTVAGGYQAGARTEHPAKAGSIPASPRCQYGAFTARATRASRRSAIRTSRRSAA